MADFNIRTDSVDVEQIMQRIRERIREKRGVDYTDDDIRELASAKLERFLDPGAVRSDLIEQYQRRRPPVVFEPLTFPRDRTIPSYSIAHDAIYQSSRGILGRTLYWIRRALNPLLKLFINPGPIMVSLNDLGSLHEEQGKLNRETQDLVESALERVAQAIRRDEDRDALTFEIFNNLVVELTRLGIEVKNLRMQVESLSSRLDFDERRARALEGVVQYRPGTTRPAEATEPTEGEPAGAGAGERSGRPRRRRRRGRRRSTTTTDATQAASEDRGSDSPSTADEGPADERPAAADAQPTTGTDSQPSSEPAPASAATPDSEPPASEDSGSHSQ